jgi:hypothetical protein
MASANGLSFELPDTMPPVHLLLYALPAFIGPTSQRLINRRLRPRPIYAVIVAFGLFFLALKAGDGSYSEFIYFQF